MEMVNSNSKITETTIGIIAYISIIGLFIAFILNNNKEGEAKRFGAFHLRQSLGLMLSAAVLMFSLKIILFIISTITPGLGLFLNNVLHPIVYLVVLIVLILGVTNAANGKKKELPFIGSFINKTLKSAFE